MADRYAVDVKVKQSYKGALCNTGFTWLSSKTSTIILADLITLAAELISEFIPLLNAVQVEEVANISLNLQARGGTVPSYFEPLGGNGSYAASGDSLLPPEWNFWLRYGCGTTVNAIGGAVETAHPIRRGGAFICGASDDYLSDGIFSIPPGQVAAWGALTDYLQDTFTVAGQDFTGAVLGEGLGTGGAWRIAPIEAAVPLRITRLRSRLAVG